jgi:hypothetical protein
VTISKEQENNKNNVSVSAYQIYYQNSTPYLDPDHDSYSRESYWVLKLYDVTFKIFEDDVNDRYVALPTLLRQVVTRHPYTYGDVDSEFFVSYRTGAGDVRHSPLTAGGRPLKQKRQDLDAQRFNIRDDIFAKKLIDEAESLGYTYISAGSYVLQALFELAKEQGLFPTDRPGGIVAHYDVIPRPFNRLQKTLADNNSHLLIQGLQPRVMDHLGEGLLPGEEYWRYQMKLKELEFWVQREKLSAEQKIEQLSSSLYNSDDDDEGR